MVMQTFQVTVLLLFRTVKELTLRQVVEKTKLPVDDAKRVLYSLSCAKYKILNKSSEGKTIDLDDMFTFNEKFTDRSRRIKIGLPAMDDKKATIATVEHDRRHAIDAAIVRTMKTRKSLAYNDLVIEVVSQLKQKFIPEPKMIKMRIEGLIEKDYIERDKENAQVFRYVA